MYKKVPSHILGFINFKSSLRDIREISVGVYLNRKCPVKNQTSMLAKRRQSLSFCNIISQQYRSTIVYLTDDVAETQAKIRGE